MAESSKRSANFSSKEETILLCLVKEYKSILENKKTDSNINKQKQECWRKIELEFNNQSGETFRDRLTLKKKYENLKKRTKKKMADEKCYTLGTGGGPSQKPIEISDIDLEIRDILAERIDGLPTEFGGDAEIITVVTEDENDGLTTDSETLTKKKDQVSESIVSPTEIANADWSKISIENLKTPTSKALNTGERSSMKRKRNEYDALCSKVSHWAASKANLEAEKIRFAEEEQKKKLEILEKKICLRM